MHKAIACLAFLWIAHPGVNYVNPADDPRKPGSPKS